MIELNPLDVLRSRELKTMPPHFAKLQVSSNDRYDRRLYEWVKTNTGGRYCINTYPSAKENTFKSATFVGFEEEKELTYFMLACPYLRRN